MEGIEKITAKIAEDSAAEIAALNAETDRRCKEIRAQAEAEAEKAKADLVSRGKKAAAERRERLESAAGMEKRKLLLAAKQEVLGEVFDAALEKLCALPEERLVSLFASIASAASVTGNEQLLFNAEDRERLGQKVTDAANAALGERGHLTLSPDTRRIRGGFVLVADDMETNCTFETIILFLREALEKQVGQILFGA